MNRDQNSYILRGTEQLKSKNQLIHKVIQYFGVFHHYIRETERTMPTVEESYN